VRPVLSAVHRPGRARSSLPTCLALPPREGRPGGCHADWGRSAVLRAHLRFQEKACGSLTVETRKRNGESAGPSADLQRWPVRSELPPHGGPGRGGEPLFQGGPVLPGSPVLLAELAHPELLDILVFGSVGFLVGEVSADIQPGILRARVFSGYSGWGPGQLEAEMAVDSWIIEPARADDVFTDAPDLLWSKVLKRKGPEYQRLSRMPYDPSMN